MKTLKECINESLIHEGFKDRFEKIKIDLYKKLNSKRILNAGTLIITGWFDGVNHTDGYDSVNDKFASEYANILSSIDSAIKKLIKDTGEDITKKVGAWEPLKRVYDLKTVDKTELDELWYEICNVVQRICENRVNNITVRDNDRIYNGFKKVKGAKEVEIELMPELKWYEYISVRLYFEDQLI